MKRAAFRRADLLLGAGVFLARVPFLSDGYGTDADAWRVAWTGRAIAATGVYRASRNPGYPIPELAAAALASAPPWAFNALTALFGSAAVVLFGAILRRLGCREWWAGALALAFTPVVAIHSADGMDYLWALAFLMGAFALALDGRAVLAGLFLGLAAGCRLTSLAMLVPVTMVLGAISPTSAPGARGPAASARRGWPALWLVAIATAAAAYAPEWTQVGIRFLTAYERGYPPPIYVLKNLSVEVWGVPGCLALAVAALAVIVRRGAGGSGLPRVVILAALAAIALELALFLRLPHESAYLIPAVPFTLLLAAGGLARRAFVALALAVVLSSFVLKVTEPGKADAVPLAGARFHLAGHDLDVHAVPGPLLYDRERRRNGVRYAESVRAMAASLPGPSAIAAYEWLPVLRVLARGGSDGPTRYLYVPSAAEFDSLRAAGIAIYDLPAATEEARAVYGYDLHERGSIALPVEIGTTHVPAGAGARP